MELTVRNTNDAMFHVYGRMFSEERYRKMDSRNGPVFSVPQPVTICYLRPWERVNYCPVRDANPFFHLTEAIWMMAGRRDVESLAWMVPRMRDFSDDGHTFNAAYGWRLFEEHGDQLLTAAHHLLSNRDSRQEVAQIWRIEDLYHSTKDKACNTQMVFRAIDGVLHTHLYNRSNDAVWGGVSGANVVHFSFFHEYVAYSAGLQQGPLYVTSSNFHIYDNDQSRRLRQRYMRWNESWLLNQPAPEPVIDHPNFRACCVAWWDSPGSGLAMDSDFLQQTVTPMHTAYFLWKQGVRDDAYAVLDDVRSPDWRKAGQAWMERRLGSVDASTDSEAAS